MVETDTAHEALRLLGESAAPSFDLVLSDIVMPGMNGIAMSRVVADRFSRIPVILMTGYSDQSLLQDAGLNIPEPFIQKPFTPEKLLRAVQDVLDNRTAVASAERSTTLR